MPIGPHLGEAIKFLRSRRGWAQKQLAAAAGVTRSMISSYEKGNTTPTLSSLLKIALALQADLCDFHCALEHVAGRPMQVHELSGHFQQGLAQPATAAARQRPAPEATAVEAPAAGQGEAPPAEGLAEAVDEVIAALRKLRAVAGGRR